MFCKFLRDRQLQNVIMIINRYFKQKMWRNCMVSKYDYIQLLSIYNGRSTIKKTK